MRNYEWKSSLSAQIKAFIELNHLSCLKFEQQERFLQHFDHFCFYGGYEDGILTKEMLESFIYGSSESEWTLHNKEILMYRFAEFMKQRGYHAYLLTPRIKSPKSQHAPHIYTEDERRRFLNDENEKLQVFQKGSPYLATKKIGKNNPKEEKIRADNYLRQEWNRNVDRALLTGASEVEVMLAKQSQIDEPVAESLREHGQNPKLFTGILQKAVGYLRGFVEFLRETKYCDRDPEGNSLINHDMRIDITPEPLPAKPKGERPSSIKQEAEVMRLQQILNKMKKQEQKIYAIEKAIVKLEKDLKEVKKKWFHRKEKKELEGKIAAKKTQLDKAKDTLDLLPMQYGYQNALGVTKAMKAAKEELKKVQQAQKEWDASEMKLEKLYLTIPANVWNVEKREVQERTGQRRSIHERLKEKKQIVEQRPKKKKSRDVGMER